MKIIVSVCVYNRLSNIKRWINCWKQCNTVGAELVIIHNYYGDQLLRNKFETYCNEQGIRYIPRTGPGMDIGALQDVFKERLPGFPDYDYLLWCCDDTFPMTKDFISPFIIALENKSIGVSCMTISASVNAHVRTTGFCIRKELTSKITFPVDPITTKSQCYLFEHMGREKTFTNQVRALGYSCVTVAPAKVSPLWDIGYHKRLDRKKEHEKMFGDPVVTFVCTIFNQYPAIISSLIMQTNNNWELWLIHNGPGECDIPNDKRITFIQTKENTGNYGHQNRRDYLQKVQSEFAVITNADNYYSPTFVEYMMNGFKPESVATYCEQMTHSYVHWKVLNCRPERGFIDCGGVMLRTEEAKEVGFNDVVSHSADWVFFNDLIKKYGKQSFQPVPGMLFVHN